MLPATSWVHYTTSCNTKSCVLEDGQNNCPKHVELTGIINRPLLLRLIGCLYQLYKWCTVKQISDNEIYLLIKYIRNVFWRVAKRLSYIEDARCLNVKLKVNKYPLNCLKSRVVCFKFQIYVFGTHDLCLETNQFWHWFYMKVCEWRWNTDLQLSFTYWYWLLWLWSVSACVVPEILKQPVCHRNDEKLQFEYLDVWSVFKPNYHVAGVTRDLVNRLAIWVPVQYMLFYRPAPQPAVATVRGITATRNLK